MQTVRGSEELTKSASELRNNGTLALVPTMGALHAGHLALIKEGRRRADRVAASIFVNPTQFSPNEDLTRYPRREAEDAQLLEEATCDLLWLPSFEDIYPQGFSTTVSVSGISSRWEGEVRPGHFDGVATVVAKLLLSVRPDFALFGEKDFQQLAVIRRMVVDLNIPVEIIGVPTVREPDGLALSSRNAYLSGNERPRASTLHATLGAARKEILGGRPIEEVLRNGRKVLQAAGFSRIDYFALVDAETLEPIDALGGTMRLLAAAVIGNTRLLDNISV